MRSDTEHPSGAEAEPLRYARRSKPRRSVLPVGSSSERRSTDHGGAARVILAMTHARRHSRRRGGRCFLARECVVVRDLWRVPSASGVGHCTTDADESRGIACCPSHWDSGAAQLDTRSTCSRPPLTLRSCLSSSLCDRTSHLTECETSATGRQSSSDGVWCMRAARCGPCADRVVDGGTGVSTLQVSTATTLPLTLPHRACRCLRRTWIVVHFGASRHLPSRLPSLRGSHARAASCFAPEHRACSMDGTSIVNDSTFFMATCFAGGVCSIWSVMSSESNASRSMLQERVDVHVLWDWPIGISCIALRRWPAFLMVSCSRPFERPLHVADVTYRVNNLACAVFESVDPGAPYS